MVKLSEFHRLCDFLCFFEEFMENIESEVSKISKLRQNLKKELSDIIQFKQDMEDALEIYQEQFKCIINQLNYKVKEFEIMNKNNYKSVLIKEKKVLKESIELKERFMILEERIRNLNGCD